MEQAGVPLSEWREGVVMEPGVGQVATVWVARAGSVWVGVVRPCPGWAGAAPVRRALAALAGRSWLCVPPPAAARPGTLLDLAACRAEGWLVPLKED